MSGALNILILGCAVAVHVADNLPPPTGLEISALGLGRVNVSWRHSANPPGEDVIYWVKVKTPDLEEEKFPSENFYLFDWLAVHRGLNVQVAAMVNIGSLPNSSSLQWASKDLPPFPGDEGTAPLILTCDIHYDESEKCWLSCHWLPGATAPLDTQYYLYFRHEMRTEKCLSYVTEPGVGRRIGCRTLITDSLLYFNEFLVHINGTSHSRQIRAAEHVFNIKDAEVIPPVWNLAFNTEDRLLSWTKPIKSLADICFNYQINVWSKVKNETITVSKVQQFSNEDLKEPTNKQHVRVRAVGKTPCWTKEKYSSWTEVIHIGILRHKSYGFGTLGQDARRWDSWTAQLQALDATEPNGRGEE
ncbi:interleukin-5 receptor subunit alpha [Mantella aurantiaca]